MFLYICSINYKNMADIKAILQSATQKEISEVERQIGLLLIEFYENMKLLETDMHKGGKQATTIVMYMNDFYKLLELK